MRRWSVTVGRTCRGALEERATQGESTRRQKLLWPHREPGVKIPPRNGLFERALKRRCGWAGCRRQKALLSSRRRASLGRPRRPVRLSRHARLSDRTPVGRQLRQRLRLA